MPAFSTMAVLALTGISTGVSAYGQWKAGSQAKKMGEAQQGAAESQAELLDYNAAIADVQAQDATQRGQEEESRFRTGVQTLIGSQRAGFAGAGVDVGFGSAVDVQADAAFLGELDALTIRTNAAREAWGYKVKGEDIRRQAQITRKEGAMAAEAGRINQSAARIGAIGTVAGTGASLLEAQYGFGRRHD
jgi:hypothetical protein